MLRKPIVGCVVVESPPITRETGVQLQSAWAWRLCSEAVPASVQRVKGSDCVVWFTVLLVWVQRSGVGTRELWVNDRTLWSVPLTLKDPWISALDVHDCISNNCSCQKCSDHDRDRRDTPPSTSNSPNSSTCRTYSIQLTASPNTNATMGKYRKWKSKLLKWARGVWN